MAQFLFKSKLDPPWHWLIFTPLGAIENIYTSASNYAVVQSFLCETYRIDANTTALLIRAALDNFLTKSPLFGANT